MTLRAAIALAASAWLAMASPAAAATFRDGRASMGTVLEIVVVAEHADAARAAFEACFARQLEMTS